MFLALGRLVVILLVIGTIAYVSLWYYARAAQRERLEQEWDEIGRPGPLESYVAEGLERRRYDLQRKLLIGVYVVPFVLVGAILYLSNYA